MSSSTNGLIFILVLSVGCGSKSDTAPEAGAPDSGTVDWGGPLPNVFPFDSTAGCQSFDTPTCNHCCQPGVTNGRLGCSELTASRSSYIDGPCPSDCQPCAQCTLVSQSNISAAVRQPQPGCDCDGMLPHIDPCIAADSCACFCFGLKVDLSSCPQFADFACIGTGNRCGVLLVVGESAYSVGDVVDVIWMNTRSEPVYLSGCVDYVASDPEQGLNRATYCPNAPPMLKVAPGQHVAGKKLSITESTSVGYVHLEGSYYLGCRDGLPLGADSCTAGPLAIQSNDFVVYATR